MSRTIINLSAVGTYTNTLIEEKSNLSQRKFNNCEYFEPEDINIPTEIADKLIRLTAKWTNRFASDLLIDIDSMRKNFSKILNDENCSNYLNVYFGFRPGGVDHKSFIEVQSPIEYRLRYIEVWKLEIYCDPFEPNVTWKLIQLEDYIDKNDMIKMEG